MPSGPVETPQVPDPTLADVTAADEPYLVAVSSVEYKQGRQKQGPYLPTQHPGRQNPDRAAQDCLWQTLDSAMADGEQNRTRLQRIGRSGQRCRQPAGKFVVETDKALHICISSKRVSYATLT